MPALDLAPGHHVPGRDLQLHHDGRARQVEKLRHHGRNLHVVVVDRLLPEEHQIAFPATDLRRQGTRGRQPVRRPRALKQNGFIRSHGQGGPEYLLRCLRSDGDHRDGAFSCRLLESKRLLESDFVVRVHDVLDARWIDAPAVAGDADARLAVGDALDADDRFQGSVCSVQV